MLNEEKVKIMSKLAIFENGRGREQLPVSKYYRSDYIGLALIKNFFLVTLGYVIVGFAVAAYFSEYLMNNIHKMDLIQMGIYIVAGYAAVVVFYSVLTYIQYSVKYFRAKKDIKKYYEGLTELHKIYEREEKKLSGSAKTGGRRK